MARQTISVCWHSLPCTRRVLGRPGAWAWFLILLVMLALTSGADVGRYAAYAGAICSFLVSYQATNALWFSINWLLVGAALALSPRRRCRFRRQNPEAPPVSGTGGPTAENTAAVIVTLRR